MNSSPPTASTTSPAPRLPGLAALRDWLALTLSIFPDFHAIVEDEIAEGDRVVQRITCYGTHQGEFSGVRPTGRPVSFQIIEISRAGADGRFAEHWSSADLPAVLRQLAGPPQRTGRRRRRHVSPDSLR